jgi:hypothetical protein
MGILKRERSKGFANDLVAGYLGQTAIKQSRSSPTVWGVSSSTRCILCPRPIKSGHFSKECIDILCEALSEHRDDLMVMYGYEEEIKTCFFKANDGLESRFIWRFKIESGERVDAYFY